MPLPFLNIKAFRTTMKVIAILAIAVVVGVWGISLYLKKVLQEKIPEIAKQATNGLYKVSIDDFRINIFKKNFTVYGVRMEIDSQNLLVLTKAGKVPHALLQVYVPEIELTQLEWQNIKSQKEIICQKAKIFQPEIHITITNTKATIDTTKPSKNNINKIYAKKIIIKEPKIFYNYGEHENAYSIQANGGNIEAIDLLVYPQQRADSSRFFYTKTTELSLQKICFQKNNSLYNYTLDSFRFSSSQHKLTLSGLAIKPTVSNRQFYKRVGRRKEIFKLHFPEIVVAGLNWEQFLAHREVWAQSVSINNGDIDIYLDQSLPKNIRSKMGNYPQQLFMKIPIPINIPVINLYGNSISYSEYSAKSKLVGKIVFGNIGGKITNLTNMPALLNKNAYCNAYLKGVFMRHSPIVTNFNFTLPDPHGSFSLNGSLKDLEDNQISDVAKALAMAEVKSLRLHSMTFDIKGNDTFVGGETTIAYNDLKIKLLKMHDSTQILVGRGFPSFVANELILYNDNPMSSEEMRSVSTYVKRDSTQSFFNVIWKHFFEAGKQTAIRPKGALEIVQRIASKKGKKKTRFFLKLIPKRKKK
jgi:hypothetical protein